LTVAQALYSATPNFVLHLAIPMNTSMHETVVPTSVINWHCHCDCLIVAKVLGL